VKRKRQYRRGYPVAVLVGFEDNHAVFWNVFSRVVKPSGRFNLNGKRADEKVLYNFHELVIEKIKPALNEGVRSVVVSSPVRTTYAQQFLEHVQKHHRYMIQAKNPQCAKFAALVGSAEDKIKVAELVKTKEITRLIEKTTSEEADQVVGSLEKHLYASANDSVVLYSLKEIQDKVYSQDKNKKTQNEYLLLTDKYLAESRQKSKIHRLMQIAQNKKIKTKVVNAETAAGNRINQFGGIVFFATE